MSDRDPIVGDMTGEPLGVLGAIDRGVYPVLDWHAVYEESLAAWLEDQRPKIERFTAGVSWQPFAQEEPIRDTTDPVSWSDILDAYAEHLATAYAERVR